MSAKTPATKRTKKPTVVPAPTEAPSAETVVPEERAHEPNSSALSRLMRHAIAGRRRMMEAQARLREMEGEVRRVSADNRSRLERLREAALVEYRNARTEAAQARRQLVSSLRVLPGRS